MRGEMTDEEAAALLRRNGVPEADVARRVKEMSAENAEIKRHMSPPGALGLPPLLDARRREYGLPDVLFNVTAQFDWVYLWQMPLKNTETYIDGGAIVMPDVAKHRDAVSAPQGIVVSAGLNAMDYLVSHGMGLGHIVWFMRLTPWRVELGHVAGKMQRLLVIKAGEICGSKDTATMLRERRLRVRADRDQDRGVVTHKVIDENGNMWSPELPPDTEG